MNPLEMTPRMIVKWFLSERSTILPDIQKAKLPPRMEQWGYMMSEQANELARLDGQILLLLDGEIVLFWVACSFGRAWRHHPTVCP